MQRHYLFLAAGILCVTASAVLAGYTHIITPLLAAITAPRATPSAVVTQPTNWNSQPPRVRATPLPRATRTPLPQATIAPTPIPEQRSEPQATPEVAHVSNSPTQQPMAYVTAERQLTISQCLELIRRIEQGERGRIPPECDNQYIENLARRQAQDNRASNRRSEPEQQSRQPTLRRQEGVTQVIINRALNEILNRTRRRRW